MTAWAAEAAQKAVEGPHPGPFYTDPEFLVAVAFILLIALVFKRGMVLITTALDDRANTISKRIEEATKLHEEAQDLLASYERKQRQAEKDAGDIMERARAEAGLLAEKAAKDLEESLGRQERMATERIAQAEAQAIKDVRDSAIDLAVEATRRLLEDKIPEDKANDMIEDAIKELPDKLH